MGEFLQTEMQEVHIPSQHGISVQRTKTALLREANSSQKKQGSQRVTLGLRGELNDALLKGLGFSENGGPWMT